MVSMWILLLGGAAALWFLSQRKVSAGEPEPLPPGVVKPPYDWPDIPPETWEPLPPPPVSDVGREIVTPVPIIPKPSEVVVTIPEIPAWVVPGGYMPARPLLPGEAPPMPPYEAVPLPAPFTEYFWVNQFGGMQMTTSSEPPSSAGGTYTWTLSSTRTAPV